MLRRGVRAFSEDAGDRDEVDDVRACCETGEEGEGRPDRAEIVDAITRSIRSASRIEVRRSAGDPRVVHEQIDARVAREHLRRHGFDGVTVGDVARLVLIGLRR